MWGRALLCILVGAYAGGLAGLALLGVADRASATPLLHGSMVEGAFGLLVFTLPGALVVSGGFEQMRGRGLSAAASYVWIVFLGAVLGGMVLLAIFRSWLFLSVGSLFGAITALCWRLLHWLVVRPAIKQ